MGDPFTYALCEGQWESIRGGRELVFLGGDRMLEWEPPTGNYRVWRYDTSYSQRDPLPGGPLAQGNWQSIRTGHELVYFFEERLLDWTPANGQFWVWQYDRNTGGDPLPAATSQGQWQSLKGNGRKLIYVDGDQVLEWDQPSGGFRLWQYDRNNRSDPFPGNPIVQGQWQSIRTGKELVYLSRNKMLEWEPSTGHYKVWNFARAGADVLPGGPVAEGTWQSIRGQHKLIRVAEDQVLDWEPQTGKYHVWKVEV